MSGAIETDVLIVGAGPAGLATAIALKRGGYAGRVIVLDKGVNPGSHVLSGAVMDPRGFDILLTEEERAKMPVTVRVAKESFRFLFSAGASVKIPWVPPMMRAEGSPVGSLSKTVAYLAQIATRLGAEVCTGYAATDIIEENGVVVGVRTGAKGIDRDGRPKANALASEEIRAKTVVLAEGAAGILTDKLVAAKGKAGRGAPSYALGIKELIDLPAPDGRVGEIMHAFGYPVGPLTYGGGFVYHVGESQVAVGYALGLDYRDAALDPHALLNRFKASSAVRDHIKGGKVVAYGAKVIPEGGYWSMPVPYVPGALIVGDGMNFVDGLRIKGVHLAIESGIAAAQAIASGGDDVGSRYHALLKASKGFREVKRVRSVHGGFSYGAPVGVAFAGFAWLTRGAFPFWCAAPKHADRACLRPSFRDPVPSAPSTPLAPDRLTDVFLSGAKHEENQPCHLKLRDPAVCAECAAKYGTPCMRFCPAEVYRFEEGRLAVDFSNCLHCKTCKIKCPYENVDWTFPQGGDGPRYTRM